MLQRQTHRMQHRQSPTNVYHSYRPLHFHLFSALPVMPGLPPTGSFLLRPSVPQPAQKQTTDSIANRPLPHCYRLPYRTGCCEWPVSEYRSAYRSEKYFPSRQPSDRAYLLLPPASHRPLPARLHSFYPGRKAYRSGCYSSRSLYSHLPAKRKPYDIPFGGLA